MKIYFETSVVAPNIEQEPIEKQALDELDRLERTGLLAIERVSARATLRETERTADETKRQDLKTDYDRLTPVAKDEKMIGFHNQSDQYGGFICNPLVSDVQEEGILSELCKTGLTQMDAQHLTQAVCNGCDVFLTRDVRSIIKYRTQIEARFRIKIRKPSELLQQLTSSI